MVASGAVLRSLYPKLFHVTCVTHCILHICALKVKSHVRDIDQLIAKSNKQWLKTKPSKPNFLLLVARLSLLSQDEEAS